MGTPIANRAGWRGGRVDRVLREHAGAAGASEEDETVQELLGRVREEVLGAYAHQDVPYEKVVERVQVERAGEAGGLFQVMVAMQNAPRGEMRMEGLELEAESVGNERAKFELTIGLGEEAGGWSEEWSTTRSCGTRRVCGGCCGTWRSCCEAWWTEETESWSESWS